VISSCTFDRISIPGTSSWPDDAPNVVVLTPEAEGVWRIGQADQSDHVVLLGFDRFESIADLRSIAELRQTTFRQVQQTDDCVPRTTQPGANFVLDAGF
jgi:hypothetical protein